MESLIIERTESTPYLNFNSEKKSLVITGESYPENAASFYAPVFSWLDDFLATVHKGEIVANLEINYFNSSSSKVLMDFFDCLEGVAGEGCSVTVNWRYHEENDMAAEYGEEFKEELHKITFNLVEFTDDT